MANDISGDRLYFDAVTTPDTMFKLDAYVLGFFWVSDEGGAIATDNDMMVTDREGKRLWGKRAKYAGDDYGITYPYPGLPVKGIHVVKLDSGVIDIQLKPLYVG